MTIERKLHNTRVGVDPRPLDVLISFFLHIGKKSHHWKEIHPGARGAEGKSTALEGYPTGEIWMEKVNLEKLDLDIYFNQMKPALQAKLV